MAKRGDEGGELGRGQREARVLHGAVTSAPETRLLPTTQQVTGQLPRGHAVVRHPLRVPKQQGRNQTRVPQGGDATTSRTEAQAPRTGLWGERRRLHGEGLGRGLGNEAAE